MTNENVLFFVCMSVCYFPMTWTLSTCPYTPPFTVNMWRWKHKATTNPADLFFHLSIFANFPFMLSVWVFSKNKKQTSCKNIPLKRKIILTQTTKKIIIRNTWKKIKKKAYWAEYMRREKVVNEKINGESSIVSF